jgi:hypothetical protein
MATTSYLAKGAWDEDEGKGSMGATYSYSS